MVVPGDDRFRVNTADVVHEVVDGEVIAIDLGRGSYYNLAGAAVPAWSMLEAGTTVNEIASTFDRAARNGTDIHAEIGELLSRLAAEALIVPAEEAGDPPPVSVSGYESPRFEKYSDMQDFFLLDPIHEVDATGWPNRRPD